MFPPKSRPGPSVECDDESDFYYTRSAASMSFESLFAVKRAGSTTSLNPGEQADIRLNRQIRGPITFAIDRHVANSAASVLPGRHQAPSERRKNAPLRCDVIHKTNGQMQAAADMVVTTSQADSIRLFRDRQ
jgi:hypothetical protein